MERLDALVDTTLREVMALLAAHSRSSPQDLVNALRRKLRAAMRNARLIGELGATGHPEPQPEDVDLRDTLPGLGPRRRWLHR